jgi:hypothetical protein
MVRMGGAADFNGRMHTQFMVRCAVFGDIVAVSMCDAEAEVHFTAGRLCN